MQAWILVLAVVAVFGLPPQDARTADQEGARITGRVVDAATSEPVTGARVRLVGSSAQGPIVTDNAGAFAFTGLRGGTYSFVVERNGSRSTSWPEASRWVRRQQPRLTLAATDRLENVTIPLERGGVVAGRITSATGEPIHGARVSLVTVVPPISTRVGTANSLGDYRLADVPPGRYILRAQPRSSTYNGPETLVPGPLPTFYPGSLQRSEARELVVPPGGELTDANVRVVEGMPSLLDVTVTHTDGRPVESATLTIFNGTDPPMSADRGGERNTSRRLALPPGEYTLQAQATSGGQNTRDRIVFDLTGMARVHLAAGVREAVTVVVGMGATASGRVFFESDGPPPPAAAGDRVPMFASDLQTCYFGTPTIAPDWSFKIDGLLGTCRYDRRPTPLTARWVLKSVLLDGRDVLDENVWFEPGRHYENVRIVLTDRRSQVRVRVSEPNGTPTGEYAAIAFPVQRERWRSPERYVRAAAPLPESFLGQPDPSDTGGEPGRSLRFIGLPAGDYYLIAVDDIEYTATRDPGALEKLARKATKVTVPERELIEVPLERYLLSDVIK
jgi:hypothetical protein